ncbi:MAG: 3'-5' exonuclease, partial [Clostridia bacterium]|nr:3'-5' exonuclease [Clostridia bacterium]
PEYGAAKYPMTIEAQALSMLDDFDAKLYEFRTAVFRTEPGEFTEKMKMLDGRQLYNHGRSNDGDVDLTVDDN